MAIIHVVPENDLIEHINGGDCICGPTVEAVFRDDGSNGWLVIHHSLDGREHQELGHDKTNCISCQTRSKEIF